MSKDKIIEAEGSVGSEAGDDMDSGGIKIETIIRIERVKHLW